MLLKKSVDFGPVSERRNHPKTLAGERAVTSGEANCIWEVFAFRQSNS